MRGTGDSGKDIRLPVCFSTASKKFPLDFYCPKKVEDDCGYKT